MGVERLVGVIDVVFMEVSKPNYTVIIIFLIPP